MWGPLALSQQGPVSLYMNLRCLLTTESDDESYSTSTTFPINREPATTPTVGGSLSAQQSLSPDGIGTPSRMVPKTEFASHRCLYTGVMVRRSCGRSCPGGQFR